MRQALGFIRKSLDAFDKLVRELDDEEARRSTAGVSGRAGSQPKIVYVRRCLTCAPSETPWKPGDVVTIACIGCGTDSPARVVPVDVGKRRAQIIDLEERRKENESAKHCGGMLCNRDVTSKQACQCLCTRCIPTNLEAETAAPAARRLVKLDLGGESGDPRVVRAWVEVIDVDGAIAQGPTLCPRCKNIEEPRHETCGECGATYADRLLLLDALREAVSRDLRSEGKCGAPLGRRRFCHLPPHDAGEPHEDTPSATVN